MGDEWSTTTLEEVVSILGDGLHGTPKYDAFGEYYFINGNNLDNGRIVFKEATKRASKVEYEKYRKDLNDRTILVSINATLGNIAFYRGEPVILGKSACYFNIKKGVDKYFIRYVLSTKVFDDYLHTYATGTTIKNVSLRSMREYPFLLPGYKEQQAIAHILGTLDDKIELNRRQNETLEAMVRAIFKSWFVDFDPVRAKMEGRQPFGMDAETAALFPDSFQDSPLGPIPKWWEVMPLGEVIELAYGKALKDANRKPGRIPVYGSNGRIGWHDEKLVDGPGIVVGRKGNPGIVTWSQTGFYPIDTTFFVKVIRGNIDYHFLYHSLNSTRKCNSMLRIG